MPVNKEWLELYYDCATGLKHYVYPSADDALCGEHSVCKHVGENPMIIGSMVADTCFRCVTAYAAKRRKWRL